MEIKRSGSQPSARGPAEWPTGTVRIVVDWMEQVSEEQYRTGK